MKKITNHCVAIIALSLFSASLASEETQSTLLSQLSIQAEGISLQLHNMQQKINTLFSQSHLVASNNNKDVIRG